jgi:hypothetical protein
MHEGTSTTNYSGSHRATKKQRIDPTVNAMSTLTSNVSHAPQMEQNLKVYWMTPIGKALQEALKKMNLSQAITEKIQEKFEKAIEKEFETMPGQSGKVMSSHAGKHKLTGSCKNYNNIY